MELIGLANYALFMGVFIGIYALLALGLNIQWGFTGLFNAGIAGFFAVGAYTSAILTSPHVAGRLGGFDLPVLAGWAGAMLAAGA
ncbi:MAG: ABC transporter permease subunit, partial [Pannonibacter phragmitetus]